MSVDSESMCLFMWAKLNIYFSLASFLILKSFWNSSTKSISIRVSVSFPSASTLSGTDSSNDTKLNSVNKTTPFPESSSYTSGMTLMPSTAKYLQSGTSAISVV